jgi:hypothetical protein
MQARGLRGRPGGPGRERRQLVGAAAAEAERDADGEPPGPRRRQGLAHREPRLRVSYRSALFLSDCSSATNGLK